jgi:fructose-bisphosphate aldolase class I
MTDKLAKVAEAMMTPGKGILAADESTGSIKKRFDSISLPSTEENRRDYRELLFSAKEGMSKCISGVILFDETIRPKASMACASASRTMSGWAPSSPNGAR